MKRLTEADRDTLVESYTQAFGDFSERQIRDAVTKYLQEGDHYPPKPKDIISRIKNLDNEKHIKELREMYTCKRCGHHVHAISDGLCFDCRGLPRLQKYKNTLLDSEPVDYIIEGRIKCQQCGKVGMCIKEPVDHGSWRCRDCYSGLTSKQRTQRFKDLIRMMEDKTFKPSWAEEPPF